MVVLLLFLSVITILTMGLSTLSTGEMPCRVGLQPKLGGMGEGVGHLHRAPIRAHS